MGRAAFQPGHRPTYAIGGQASEEDLDLNTDLGTAHQMLNEEGAFHLFVAGFNGLALVVVLEPSGQSGEDAIIPIMDQPDRLGSVSRRIWIDSCFFSAP
jgi:hypothetical protein